jgi:hypothetical protein
MASVSLPLALLTSALTYGTVLFLLRAVSPEEWEMLAPLIPAPVRRLMR